MSRHAEWRTLPNDPRSPVGWIVREAPRCGRIMLRRATLGLAAVAFYALETGAYGTFVATSFAIWAFLKVIFPGDSTNGPPAALFLLPGPLLLIRSWRGLVRLRRVARAG